MRKRTIDFRKFSSIKIGPATEVLLVEKEDPLPKDHTLIGHANNLLIGPNPPPLMMLSKDFDFIKVENGLLVIGAATPTGKILSYCKRHDIGGFEFVAKLPGSLGGMLAMNAGVKEYETFNSLVWIEHEKGRSQRGEIEHGYRYAKLPATAFCAAFKIERGFDENLAENLKKLRGNQPKEPSAGSVFKNPPGNFAGKLIEEAGLKGKRVGNMAWSQKHANFLVNLGGGTFEEAIELIEQARKSVLDIFGTTLELEIKIINHTHQNL